MNKVTDDDLHRAWSATGLQWHRLVTADNEVPERFTPEHRDAGAELLALSDATKSAADAIIKKHGLTGWSAFLHLVSLKETT